jgi:hypothetical protein
MGQPAALDEDAILKYRITTGIAATRGEAPIKRVVKWQALGPATIPQLLNGV